MKVCLLSYRGNPFSGGQGVYVSNLGRELARLGHEVHCISGPPYPDPCDGMVLHRLPSLKLFMEGRAYPPPGRPLWALHPLNVYERIASRLGIFAELNTFSIRAFAKVRELARQGRFDIIHDNQCLGWGLLPLQALGMPLVATIHHPLSIDRQRGWEPPTDFRAQLNRALFFPLVMQGTVARRLPRIVTVSDVSAEAITRDFRVSRNRIAVVHNGLDSALFRPLPQVAPVPGRVIFVGNLQDPNKGGRYLLEAAGMLPPAAHLLIVTGGITRWDWVNGLLERFGLHGRVQFRFKVELEELVRLYATAEVAVSPSVFEGFGFPAAEAMACGLPLVAARGGALPEVVGDAGVLVPPRDAGALARAITALLGDAPRRAALGQAARTRIMERFRWESAARRLEAVYREVIHAHG